MQGSLPDFMVTAYEKVQDLRYGENWHQKAALYRIPGTLGLYKSAKLNGREMSYNNVVDAETVLEMQIDLSEYDGVGVDKALCVIVKHANPCGVALGAGPLEAYTAAYRTDPSSAFGGIIAFNRELDAGTARAIIERQFAEVIAAPGMSAGALAALAAKPNLRLLATGALQADTGDEQEFRSVTGGLLLQQRDSGRVDAADMKIVTRRRPETREFADLMFAWQVAKFVKSNAIVLAHGGATLGVGAGQMSRVYSTRIAALKAADEKLEVRGAVMASVAGHVGVW
jgi:phosphoribosylaminoimidazolecarboxamide formyltransferase/IMP cyclohydrolase